VAQELCRVLTTWSCHVSVFDNRAEWLERLPSSANLDRKLCANMADEVPGLPVGTLLLSLTQGHAVDVPVLLAAFKRAADFPLIGVIGSDVKALKIKKELLSHGADPEVVARLVCPLGLPIGDNTPAEIAISICAQLLAVRDKVSFKVESGFYD
jgi:xanthine dehydrogenase accessory factor